MLDCLLDTTPEALAQLIEQAFFGKHEKDFDTWIVIDGYPVNIYNRQDTRGIDGTCFFWDLECTNLSSDKSEVMSIPEGRNRTPLELAQDFIELMKK